MLFRCRTQIRKINEQATTRFIVDGAQLLRSPDNDNRLMHTEVRIDDMVLMLADSTETVNQ